MAAAELARGDFSPSRKLKPSQSKSQFRSKAAPLNVHTESIHNLIDSNKNQGRMQMQDY